MPHIYGLEDSAAASVKTAARIARETALPKATEVDATARFPQETMSALAENGLLGLVVPQEFGGKQQGPGVFASVIEEIAQACPSSAMIYCMHVTAAQTIASSTRLRARGDLLSEIARGKHLTTLAFSEKGSRSQFWAPVSLLAESGDGYKTSAAKSWVTAGAHADSYVSVAKAQSGNSPFESTLFLVRSGAPGVRLGSGFDGLGLRGNDSIPVDFDCVPVSTDDLISEPGGGLNMMLQAVVPWFAIGTAAMANGICRAVVMATAGHLSGAGFENDGTKLRDLPTLRARLAEMSVRTEQSRALLGYALGELEHPNEMTPLYLLQSRLAAITAAVDVTDLAMKACGGAAFSKQLGIERLFRDARAGWVMAPTVDHLQDFVGKALTGLPLF
jgi:alkylation response protein AidB-like acyl-CoA dehydrogenase